MLYIIKISILFSIYLLLPITLVSSATPDGLVRVEENAADIDRALALITAAGGLSSTGEPALVTYDEQGQVLYSSQMGKTVIKTFFSTTSKAIAKHISINSDTIQYSFSINLITRRKFENTVRHTPQGDALIFDNGTDMFIYTQETDAKGHVDLKEWIYARRPNARYGSRYTWFLKPEIWQWPLTVELQDNGQMALYRNMPVYGVPMTDAKQRAHVQESVTYAFKPLGHTYFPFHDKIADMAVAFGITKEGFKRLADVSISDEPMDLRFTDSEKFWNSLHPTGRKGKKGPDWSHLTSTKQNIFEVYMKARKEEYPLLIDPTLKM